jgi:hypothetical protein
MLRDQPEVQYLLLALIAVNTDLPLIAGREGYAMPGIGADSASAASCRTGAIQYVVPHVPPLLRSFPILIVKHHEQQDVEVRNSKLNF